MSVKSAASLLEMSWSIWPVNDMETVYIDGSRGEGGGQILRTSLALSCITARNLHIENIRAARRNPGLAKQHLSCVEAARQICDGQCRGAALHSQVLDFQPRPIRGGDFSFDIGSAGSASLVVQTVLPALFLAANPRRSPSAAERTIRGRRRSIFLPRASCRRLARPVFTPTAN